MDTGTVINDPLKEFILQQISRIVTNQYKSQLNEFAELNQLHLKNLYEAKDKTKSEILLSMNYFTPEKMGAIRKHVLDTGNDSIREIRTMFEKINITLNQ